MALSHRLKSSMDVRLDEGIDEKPKRIVFLSVEGTVTEKSYFNLVDKYRTQLGIKAVVHIETLSRGSNGASDPKSVWGLLEDYLQIRNEGILPGDIASVLYKTAQEKYSLAQIEQYLNGKLEGKDSIQLKEALKLAGIDLDYQKFLSEYNGEDDVFGIVIDRDHGSHTVETLKELQKKCEETEKCYCFITNPCFEFWLLLHVCDVKSEYATRYEDLLKNERISSNHTFVSRELSEKAKHAKKVTEKAFGTFYLPNIDTAIARTQEFAQNGDTLLQNLGTNLPQLFQILREDI